MKSLLSSTILIFLVRIVLGGLFIVASLDKIIDPIAFATSIINYKIVGSGLAMFIATILPWLELICGLGLILGLYPHSSALLITVMLIGFTVLVASALLRGLDISCGCFTQDPNASKIGYQKIIENVGIIALGIFLLFSKVPNFSILNFLKTQKHPDTNSPV